MSRYKMSINKQKLVQLTKIVLGHLETKIDSRSGDFNNKVILNKNKPNILLRDEGYDAFSDIIDLISKDNAFEDVSISTIEKEYTNVLYELLVKEQASDDEIKKEINFCLNKLQQSIEEWLVLFPIDGLEFGIEEINIGKVHLYPFDNRYNSIKNCLFSIIDKTNHTDTEKEYLNADFVERTLSKFSGKICAEVAVKSEKDAAYLKAFTEIDHAINLLRCYIPLLFQRNLRVSIGVGGTIPKHNFTTSITINEDCSSFKLWSEITGPIKNYKLDKDRLNHLIENCSLNDISDILLKNSKSRSNLEQMIVTAVRWIGLGVHDTIDTDKFLKFTVALECLLMRRGEYGSKADSIAERCAFILSDDPEERQQKIYRNVKNLYDIRSSILHNGIEEIDADRVRNIQMLSINCLLKVIDRSKEEKWNSVEDLIGWTKKQRFK